MKRRHILPASATAFIIIGMAAILTAGGNSQPRLNPETGGDANHFRQHYEEGEQ